MCLVSYHRCFYIFVQSFDVAGDTDYLIVSIPDHCLLRSLWFQEMAKPSFSTLVKVVGQICRQCMCMRACVRA